MKVFVLKLFIFTFLFFDCLFAQNNLSVLVKDAKTNSPLIGANVYFTSLHIGGATDTKGFVKITNIPEGNFVLSVSYIGYEKK